MLKQSALEQLQDKKNLLAFSAGGDSTALFFLLLEHNIKFDIAIVNYGIREQSKEEIIYAQELSKSHNLECHIFDAIEIGNNFEAQARKIRYSFFQELIKTFHYTNLLTAHHLGDRFEWMLMQFCKGAGCAELSGMKEIQTEEGYTLVRPLLHYDKQELLQYLQINKYKYFEDETNLDISIKRNAFRHNFTQPLLEKHLNGIKKSFKYLDEDIKSLLQTVKIKQIKDFAYFKNTHHPRSNIFAIDKYLKSCGHIISAKERELLKNKETVVVGRKYLINQNKEFVFIAPFIEDAVVIDKNFKEQCRKMKIEPKLRKYLFLHQEIFETLKEFHSHL